MEFSLAEIAHARAGDKGDSSILFLSPYDAGDFLLLSETVTPTSVAAHFGVADSGLVTITLAPILRAMTIVIRHQLAGGVTRSPSIDPHGKTLSGHLLDLTLERPGRDIQKEVL